MDNNKWRQKVYGPYSDFWKVIKILQFASDNNPELFTQYMDEVQKFDDAYQGNEFAELLHKVLLRADDLIAKMNREDPSDAIQKTE